MVTIRDILKEKDNIIYSVSPDTTVYEALEKMSAHDVGSILVMEKDKLLGIFTERDYLKKVVLHKRSSKTTPIKEIMTPNPVCIGPGDSLDDALAIMTKQHCRHLPVIEEGNLTAIISIGDLVKKKISAMDATIKYLSDYISASNYH